MEVILVVCIILGQPGVGKTHFKYLLLDQRPPHLRSSTICAETPVRIEIRTVSGSKIHNVKGNWKEVDGEEMLDIVAKMVLLAEPQLCQKPDQGLFSKVASWFQSHDRGTAGARLPTLNPAPKKKAAGATPALSDACQKAVNGIMDKLVQRITSLRSEAGQDD